MKAILKSLVPPLVISTVRAIRKPFNRPSPEVVRLKESHDKNNAGVPGDEIVLRPGLKLGIHPSCRESFEYFCFRSPDSVEEMDGFLQLTTGKSRLLDIGALHGVFSLAFVASGPAKNAIAVDASPMAFPKLLYNVHKSAKGQITTVERAVSDATGILKMNYEWEHAVAAEHDTDAHSISVPMTTGDEICAENDFQPDVIKIDVEGYEVKVIKGLAGILSTCRPLVFLEIHPARIKAAGDQIGSLLGFFKETGYQPLGTDLKPLEYAAIATASEDIRVVLNP